MCASFQKLFPLHWHFLPFLYFSVNPSISLFYDDKESVFLRFPLLLPLFIFHPCTFPSSFPLLAQANFSFSYLPVCRLVAHALSSLSQGFLFSLVSCTPFISPSSHPCYPLTCLVSNLRVARMP